MRKKTFSLILSGILPITALSFTAFANGGDTAGRPVTPPSATDVIGQIGSSATEAYTASLNFWNDYGNNISDGFNLAGESWNSVKNTPGFETSYGDAVKTGDGIFSVAGFATNLMDSLSAANQLTHPQDNPYASHPALSTAYDTLTAWQAMMNWADMAVGDKDPTGTVKGMNLLLGEAVKNWSDVATQTALLDYANHSTLIGTVDITLQNVNDYYTDLFQNVFYPSRDAEWSLEDWWKKSYYDKLNFYAQMVREGREKEFEWLRDELLNMAPKAGSTILPNHVTAKKPNIYLYPETETEITVTFGKPGYLTLSIPEYNDGWTVTASPDGTLTDKDKNSYGYLFYEALVQRKAFSTEEGFIIPANKRAEAFREILASYGFNEQETADFIEYWADYLKDGTDYVMHPMLTEGVDNAMPLTFSVKPDSIYRIWFGFAEYSGDEIMPPEITPIVRKGFTVIEWGGAVLD